MKQQFFLLGGFSSLGLAILGIALPLLPTTPFLLLSAYCFAQSSARWHRWLIHHKHFGPYIAAFREGKGLTKQQKWRIGLSVTVMVGLSLYFAPLFAVRCLLASVWGGCLAYLFLSRTASS